MSVKINYAVLLFGNEDFNAAHVGTQNLGNGYAAVSLKMVFKIGDQHTRGRDDGVIEGVREVHFAVLVLDTDLQAACLRVTEVGAGADLEVFLLARRPRLDEIGRASCRERV